VQRILRHSDPRITTGTYGHLQPDYLRSEIDRLRFGTAPANNLADLPNAPNRSQPSARIAESFLQPSYKARDRRDRPLQTASTFTKNLQNLLQRGGRDLNPRPPA
jgi:hypothetical protein